MSNLTQKYLLFLLTTFFITLITFLITLQIRTSATNEEYLAKQQIIQEAKAHFKVMVDTRSWNAQYGGVYVDGKGKLKPNKYLKNNTLKVDDNRTLIRINPAWMSRQIFEIANKSNKDYHFSITSLIPLNPTNQADTFEREALEFFDKNKDEKYYSVFNTKEKNFNFMGALPTTQACLKCHEHQGYKVGDIRGGIRVSIPLKVYQEHQNILEEKTSKSIYTIIAVAFVLLLLIVWFIEMLYRRKYEIEHANEILENEVSKRTTELNAALTHEQHLKDILKVVTEVNEMLITSYSTKAILRNATLKLTQNTTYSFVCACLVHENLLEVIAQSAQEQPILDDKVIDLDNRDKKNFMIDAIEKATKLKHSIIEKAAQEISTQNSRRKEDQLELNWMIALPLIHDINDSVFGVITVFSSKEDGFDVEEIKILENMAHDISIALYSHKQKDSILSMEKEKTANYEETILAFVNIIEQRDTYTAGHTIRVAEYCSLIAREMGLNEEEIHKLEKAAILHDIGKVATPDAILLKPGKLSLLEYELIKQHSEVGADMLEHITIYKDLANIIRYHHSRYDGKGYPRTSSPDEIPKLSQIMIVADAFDAMTTNRIYRPRKSIEEAIDELIRGRGFQFHPDVVDAAISALENVTINSTSQMPSSELEHRRMSYFFHDTLTESYNEDYLLTTLDTPNHNYVCLNIIELKKFRAYNKIHGWENGNKFLKKVSKYLRKKFPDAMIVRYHGDDFILLNKSHISIDAMEIESSEVFKDSEIHIKIKHHDINEQFDFAAFSQLLG